MPSLNAPIQPRSPDRSGRWFGQLRIHEDIQNTTRQKDYVPFHCTGCGSGGAGEWHMQLQNVLIGIGCPCCESIAGVQTMFASAAHLTEYVLKARASPSGRADVGSVRYRLLSPAGTESDELSRSGICSAIRKGRIPGGASIKAQESVDALMDAFIVTFPHATITFEAWSLPNNSSPGPFFQVSTGTRTMREEITGLRRAQFVQALIKKEQKDKKDYQRWSAIAAKHGASIEGCIHTQGSPVRIRYLSRSGFPREETFQRAQESSWGHTRFKKGEKLCQAVMLSLFPGSTWTWNQRYAFLALNGRNLELDGYCKNLALAFEHQGAQHHSWSVAFHSTVEEFNDLVARDAFKVERCRENGICLVVIDAMNLDAGKYLEAIRAQLRKTPLQFDETVTAAQVNALWQQLCANPLQSLQDAVIEGLGPHELLSPSIDQVAADTRIRYRCGACGKKHSAMAKSFADCAPRTNCPSCKGRRSGDLRRLRHLATLREGLPPAIFSRVSSASGERLSLVCDQGHREIVSSLDDILSRHDGVAYNCPHCQTLALGFTKSDKLSRLRAAALEQYRPVFEENIRLAGLVLTAPIAYVVESSSLVAEVKCGQGHAFSIAMAELTKLLQNTYLRDRAIVPTVCPTCCYPDGPYNTKDSTVFHRLAVLKTLHPHARYVSGFDPTGRSKERYACGESHPLSQIQHAGIWINFRTLATQSKIAALKSFCYECAEERGVLKPSFDKNIAMVRGRMLVIAEAIAKRRKASVLTIPTATVAQGENALDGSISTTKTLIRFDCGAEGHIAEVKTSDAYFARAGGKPGYCRACLTLAGVKTVSELLESSPKSALR